MNVNTVSAYESRKHARKARSEPRSVFSRSAPVAVSDTMTLAAPCGTIVPVNDYDRPVDLSGESVDATVGFPSLTNILAVLGAVAMFFSTLEFLIPKPVPFFRIGLANIPILLAMRSFRVRHVLALTLVKVVGQGLINGTLASYVFLFSLVGSFASVLVMILVSRLGPQRVSLIGVSVAGAVASNIVQIVLSVLFIFGPRSWIIAPPFLILGTAAGLFVGAVAEYFYGFSAWIARMETDYRRVHGGSGGRHA